MCLSILPPMGWSPRLGSGMHRASIIAIAVGWIFAVAWFVLMPKHPTRRQIADRAAPVALEAVAGMQEQLNANCEFTVASPATYGWIAACYEMRNRFGYWQKFEVDSAQGRFPLVDTGPAVFSNGTYRVVLTYLLGQAAPILRALRVKNEAGELVNEFPPPSVPPPEWQNLPPRHLIDPPPRDRNELTV